MFISKAIMIILALFFVIGLADRLLGNRFGFGAEIERGFSLMGIMGLTAVGLLCLAPVVAKVLRPVIAPLFSIIGADPAMLPGALFGPDISTPIAIEMADNSKWSLFSGLIVGSVMGNAVSFAIPVATGIISKGNRKYLTIGVLCGFILDPVACFAGGLLMGLEPLGILINLIPMIVVAIIIIAGLLRFPNGTMKAFQIFAKLLMTVISIGLAAAAVESMTGFTVIRGMNPISDAFKTVGTITLSIGGSLPLLLALRRLLKKPLGRLEKLLKINGTAVLDMILAFSTVVAGYSDFDKMDPRGRATFAAFTASASNAFGVCLGMASAYDKSVVMPMLVSKMLAGVMAMFVLSFFYPRLAGDERSAADEIGQIE